MKKKNGVMVKSMGAAHFRSPFQSFAGDSEIHQCSASSFKVSVMDCIEPVFSSCVCVCVCVEAGEGASGKSDAGSECRTWFVS